MRNTVFAVAAIGLAVGAATPAAAATRDIDSTIKLAHVEDTGDPPISGSAEYAGTFKGALGSGAVVGRLSYAAPDFHGTFRVFLNRGTLKGTMEGSGSPRPGGGGFDVSGTGQITKGSGKFRGAHGDFTFTGGQPADPPIVSTLEITGSFKH